MTDESRREANPLVQRVDALLKRHQDVLGVEGEVPVLTEIVESDAAAGAAPKFDAATVEALARMLERAVLERLGPEVDRVIAERLAGTLNSLLEQALAGVRQELTVSVTQMVREAIAASVARALQSRSDR